MSPVPARRGVRDRGRRRDRPRPRPLRALHRRQHVARLERHGRRRSTTRSSAASAAATTSAAPSRSSRTSPTRSSSASTLVAESQRRRRRHHRDRRHGRRHRVAAVPRGDPPVPGRRRARRSCMFIHLTLVPYIGHAGELKTKPTQHSVNELRRIGIQPDMVVCRSEERALARRSAEDRAVRDPAGRGGRLRARRRQHLQGAARLPRARASTTSSSTTSASRRRRPTSPSWEAIVDRARARPSSRCGSRSSASTSSSRTPTCRSSRRCATPASMHGGAGRDRLDRLRAARGGEAARAPRATPTAS